MYGTTRYVQLDPIHALLITNFDKFLSSVEISHCHETLKNNCPYLLEWEHKRKERGKQKRSGAQSDIDKKQMAVVDDKSVKEELETWKHFLMDSELDNWRHRVYISAMATLHPKYQLRKVNYVFDSPNCAARLNRAFGFVLENVEVGSCRYYIAQERKEYTIRKIET